MKLSKTPRIDIKDEVLFRKLVKKAFSTRRKMLKNALDIKDDQKWEAICAALGTNPKSRAENLSLAQFAQLSNTLDP